MKRFEEMQRQLEAIEVATKAEEEEVKENEKLGLTENVDTDKLSL